ncbi:uncharacterized protein LOC113523007 [Galleria mellonella]|uniref:Uncharacterized protein LOC113523007 n=1 Tax=Galleria mellonella TaxID=7137 RepID=A0A6J1X5I0_GALME|nr:uncharacterized protein LOC113523007 [Galleria mellonella]
MEDLKENNTIIVEQDTVEEYEFKYNFLNTPWDDRSTKSKVGIITLLTVIFTGIAACVINNLCIHYKGFQYSKIINNDIKCHLIKMDDYSFTARIHLASTHQLLCVGAVISSSAVLVNGMCVKAGPILLRLGSLAEPRCKKRFSVDAVEPIQHDGVIGNTLVLLYIYENIVDCAKIIRIGQQIDWNSTAYIIGRPLHMGKTLSRQPATLANQYDSNPPVKNLNKKHIICVKDLARCPVRAGDLLIQNGYLFGLASTSIHHTGQSKSACFADLNVVRHEISDLGAEV